MFVSCLWYNRLFVNRQIQSITSNGFLIEKIPQFRPLKLQDVAKLFTLNDQSSLLAWIETDDEYDFKTVVVHRPHRRPGLPDCDPPGHIWGRRLYKCDQGESGR